MFKKKYYVIQKRGPEKTLKIKTKNTEKVGPETLKMEFLLRQNDGLRKNTFLATEKTLFWGVVLLGGYEARNLVFYKDV